MGMQLYVTEIIDFLPQSSKMDASNFTIFFLVTLFAQSSHQWTDQGSTQFLSEGTSTVFEVSGDSSAGCFLIFKSSDKTLLGGFEQQANIIIILNTSYVYHTKKNYILRLKRQND